MTTVAPVTPPLRGHVLDVEGLDARELMRLCDLAIEMREARATRRHRFLLEAETVALAFFEPSTRTRISFQLAATALGATTVDLVADASSVRKGESLVDTVRTLERTGVTILVLRHAAAGAAHLAARVTGLSVINAGDGAHAHPTQALIDLFTLREALGRLEGREVAIVGDVVHSRVARSNIHALVAVGARVRVAGPPAWVAGFETWEGVDVASSLDDALVGADAVMALRVQLERDAGTNGPALAEYVRDWRLDRERLRLAAPHAPVLHPGPTNEGVEITADLANGPRSLIGRQVENGVPVRMAVLARLAGGR
jgi:aspartate carbamoyltransferase catalytic subunit